MSIRVCKTEVQSVTSSASYLPLAESEGLEVQRVPGIGFSSCAMPTFNCVQGILDGGYELSFWKVPEWRKHTRRVPSTSQRVSEMEVQSKKCAEVLGSVEYAGSN